MTERRSPYLHLLRTQDMRDHALPGAAATILPLGQMTIQVDDSAFQHGYEEGRTQYQQWHQQDRSIDTSTLLVLVRNGWGGSRHPEMWQTGYIIGWLFALFTQATSETERERQP